MYSNLKVNRHLMADVGPILKFAMLTAFLVVAILRVIDDNKVIVNYVNIIACALAICTVIATTQTFFRDTKQNDVLIVFHIINILFFAALLLFEFRKPFINLAWSDFLSIFALAVSLFNTTVSKLLKCFFKYGEILIYKKQYYHK